MNNHVGIWEQHNSGHSLILLCLHTMYIDKPMKGHNLMQAIASVNRVYKDKAGGLIVDYLGIASDSKEALSFYSESGGKGDPAETQEKAVQMMLEKIRDSFPDISWLCLSGIL